MNKTLFALIAVGIILLPSSVFAAGGNTPPQLPDVNIHNPQDVINIAKGIVVWIYRLFFVAAVGFILWAAFLYLTARDDAAKVTKAKASLKNAVIAIVIALVASGASALIESVFTSLKQ